MPKGLSRKREEQYDSDDGFVEDAPKSKKSKSNGASKNTGASGTQQDDEGNEYWEISKNRRVQVSDFKGNTMIGIREFYEKDGKTLPGKKGISLTFDQFKSVLEILPGIEAVLKAKGMDVPRPAYDGAATVATKPETDVAPNDEEEENDDNEEPKKITFDTETKLKPSSSSMARLEKFKMKKNHEETSDEEG